MPAVRLRLPGRRGGGADRAAGGLGGWGPPAAWLRLTEWFMRVLVSLNQDIERQVLGSGVSRSLYRYASRSLLALTLTAGLVGTLASLFAALVLHMPWAAAVVAGVLASVSASAAVLAALITLPRLAYSSRGARLEPLFPLIASALVTRLLAGINLSNAVLEVAEEEAGELREFRVELEYLSSLLRAGVAPERAFEEAARITPSTSLRSLFSALATAAKTGAGIEEIVDTVLREYLFNVETEIDRVSSSLGAYMELFVAASVMLPIAVGVVGLLLVFSPIPGLSFNTLLFVTTFILVPMTAAGIMVLSDMTVSRIRL